MLRTGQLDEAAAIRGLETVERSARAQATLIEDILDVSRIVSGKLHLNIRSTELLSIIAAAIEVVRPAVIAKGIDLQVKVDASVGQIQGDSDRLQQVVWNLLSNAAKFTDAGGRIEVKLERADQHALITVSDTGQGISPEFLPYVFDRFRQAESLLTRRHSGLGLGLAIVRHLVEMHGGTVQAESAGVGHGAVFKVKFPLTESRSTEGIQATELEHLIAATECSSFNSSTLVKGLRVMVVDDDDATREAILAMLEQGGAEVTACSSAGEAMEMMQLSKPDVIVSDLAMPDEDGYSFISKVRALNQIQGGQVPALALTAHVRMEDRLKALSSGYQLFMPKPVEGNELLVSIAALARITDKGPSLDPRT
jgi:CheY-like chemotaxis protein